MPASSKTQPANRPSAAPALDVANARAIALGGGDASQAIRRRVTALLAKSRNNIFEAFKTGIQELVATDIISKNEAQQIGEIFRLVMNVERDRADAEDAYLKIREIYQDMIASLRSSPAALAIVGVASSSFSLEKNSPLKVNKVAGAAGAIAGAAVGAGLGSAIGGPIGGAIGGVIGGAVGGTVGLCG